MTSGLKQQQSRLKELISRGREQGYLTYSDVNDHLPDDISDQDVALLAELHNIMPLNTKDGRDRFLTNVMVPYRGRGYIVSLLQALDHLVTRPIQLQVGFAVPNAAALQRIQSLQHQRVLKVQMPFSTKCHMILTYKKVPADQFWRLIHSWQ